MKNFLFAVQIFGLMAIFPTLVSLDIAHGTKTVSKSSLNAPVPQGKKVNTGLSTSVGGFSLAALAFGKLKFESSQKCSTNCTCQDCKCDTNCTCQDF